MNEPDVKARELPAEIPEALFAVSGTELDVCRDIASRQQLGIRKYGMTVATNPAQLREWLQHAYEESLDKAIYLKRAIAELDSTNDQRTSGSTRRGPVLPKPESCPRKLWERAPLMDRRIANGHAYDGDAWVHFWTGSIQWYVPGKGPSENPPLHSVNSQRAGD